MKRGVIVAVLFLFLTLSFIGADIVILEVNESSTIGTQVDSSAENYDIQIAFIGDDGVKFVVNGENSQTIPKTPNEPYYVNNYGAGGLKFVVTDFYLSIKDIDPPANASILIIKEINISGGEFKKIVFEKESYGIYLDYISSDGVNINVNGERTIRIPEATAQPYYIGPRAGGLRFVVKEIIIPPMASSPSRATILVIKEAKISDGEQVNFQFIDNPGISLEDAEVTISCDKTEDFHRTNYIDTYFKLKNNRNEEFDSTLYLKADGFSCYGDCEPMSERDMKRSIYININDENYYDSFLIDINDEKYVAFNYTFEPHEEINLTIGYQDIQMPFNYYLDSLLSYQSAKHEKITVEGYCDAIFNEHYPINLISNEDNYKTWVWEYSDINVLDGNLGDILVITESALPSCTPNWECREWSNWTCDINYEYAPWEGQYIPTIAAGNETRGCSDGCGNSRMEYRSCETISDDTCPQIGLREDNKYCSLEEIWEIQLPNKIVCENSFECESNVCTNGSCQSKILPEPNYLIYWLIGILAVMAVIGVIVVIIFKNYL